MAFLFDESGIAGAGAHRSIARGVPLLLVTIGLVLVLFFRTGLDLLLWAVGILAAALVARGAGNWFADHLGAKGELVVLLVLLGGFWATMTWIEPARKAAMSPFYRVLAFGQSRGYGGLWMSAPAPANAVGGGASPAARPSPGSAGQRGAMPAGGTSPASTPRATGDERSSLTSREVPTTTTIRASGSSVAAGTPVTLTAEVRAPDGVPEGRVHFVFNDTAMRRASMQGSGGAGTASLTLDNLKVGVYDIAAEYPGSGRYRASVSMPLRVVVRPAR